MPLPTIHVYCFAKAATAEAAQAVAAARLLRVLARSEPGQSIAAEEAQETAEPPVAATLAAAEADLAAARALLPDLAMRHVRDVSPRTFMLCCSFTLPRSIAQRAPEVAGPAAKRARLGA